MKSVRLTGILIISLFILLCYSSCTNKAGEVKSLAAKDTSLVSSAVPLLSWNDGILCHCYAEHLECRTCSEDC